jgi:tRNA(Arg) A34 adenosine deaminase TadA
MIEVFNGMEQLPGFPPIEIYEAAHDARLDKMYPWLRNMFDRMMLTGIPQGTKDIFATYRRSEFPISAAVVVPTGSTFDVIGIAPSNRTNELYDSSAHAEMLAIHMATPSKEKHAPKGAILLSILEPCARIVHLVL